MAPPRAEVRPDDPSSFTLSRSASELVFLAAEVGLAVGAGSRAGWKPGPGNPWSGGEGLESGSWATPSRAPAAQSPCGSPDRPRHKSLDTSPIILYLCFTLLFFPSLIVSLWGRQRI